MRRFVAQELLHCLITMCPYRNYGEDQAKAVLRVSCNIHNTQKQPAFCSVLLTDDDHDDHPFVLSNLMVWV
jgi:hypothetical protein